ncbi:MAG: glutamine--tRNA ligase/YqeY domain fusion protein [Gemmatimonadetes bacterium]|nr:glutamine--tRNA ligase/YqeY domain fusion protein [Gemmatimonadota bacterium]
MGPDSTPTPTSGRDFVRQIIDRDLVAGRNAGRVITRFPPEPNGFLHIGHAKSIVFNFGLAAEYAGARCHLRFDDTNPTTEDVRYVHAIKEDVRWLGYDWGEHLYFASDYFDEMYAFAEELIRKGLAYVDSQSEEAIREQRGTVTESGLESPHRQRAVEENLRLFREMKARRYRDGEHVLRAKIDMASANMLMRDPVLYRIRHADHYRTGGTWCIYPLYDYAHPLEDALEGVTHSLCTLEFANNRELYDWVVENVSVPHRPRQYEFARLSLDYTVMSKRRFLRLVEEGDVAGWDDPRMPTLAGLRRRGITPEAIREFCEMVGVARADSRVDLAKLEYAIRDNLNRQALRVLAVLRPLKVTLIGWPTGRVETSEAPYFPRDVPQEGSRPLACTGALYIDRDDFSESPPPGFRRLVPGGEVRLRYAHVIRCEEVLKDASGSVTELRCSYDPATWGQDPVDGRSVKGTIQWVSAAHAVPCAVRLYDRLFTVSDPEAAAASRGGDSIFKDFLNPASLEIIEDALVEPSVLNDPGDTRYQFERVGYFWRDPVDGRGDRPVFNRIVTLRDTWAKVKGGGTRKDALSSPRGRTVGGKRTVKGVEAVTRRPRAPAATPPRLEPEVRERSEELRSRWGLDPADAEILARDPSLSGFFLATVSECMRQGASDERRSAAAVANWMINALPPLAGGRELAQLPFGAPEFAALVSLVEGGVLSGRGGAAVLEVLAREGGSPSEIMERLGLRQVSDADALSPIVKDVVRAHPAKVEEYRAGKEGLMGFFMGQVMQRTEGRADPKVARELLEQALAEPVQR